MDHTCYFEIGKRHDPLMFIILMFVVYIPTLLKYQHICWHLPDQHPY